MKSGLAGLIAAHSSAISATRPSQPTNGSLVHNFIDIRALTGGDGDISDALRRAKEMGKSAWIDAGSYSVVGRFAQDDMTIWAAPDATIEAAGNDSVVFVSQGALNRLPQLARDIGKGGTQLSFVNTHGLAAGDWIIVYDPADFSWHASRPYYRAGEWCKIASASARGVTLEAPLRDDYARSKVDLYRAVLRRPVLRGGIWLCGHRELVRYTACTGGLIDVDRVEGASNTVIHIDRCVDADIQCRTGHNTGAGLDDYLISIGNSQSVRVTGDRLYSRRHPVAIGGGDLICGVPCRDCTIDGLVLENDPNTNVMCADIHGNAEDCSYVRCVIFGGISLGGASPAFRHCKIYARSDGTAAEATELKGGAIDLTGLEITTDATNVGGGRGVIDIGTQNSAFNGATSRDLTLSLSRFKINAPRLAQDEAIIRIRNAGSQALLNVHISKGRLLLGQPVQLLRTELASGKDRSNFIKITDVSGLPRLSRLHFAVSGAYGKSTRELQRPL